MLTELCQEIHNWFEREKHFGTFTIENGVLDVDFLKENQYFRVMGSVFNDGVYKYAPNAKAATDTLTDETFEGAVWALGIPKAVLALADEIDAWREKYENTESAAMSPFNSESFGGYSYSKGGGNNTSGSGSGSAGWKGAFAARLNMWRKL